MKKILLLLVFPLALFAASPTTFEEKYLGVKYNCDITWRNKDFTGHDLTKKVIAPGTVIFGSCFSREKPDSKVFPDSMTGVTFLFCNLDNVVIPAGCTVIACSQRRFLVQNDGCDWIVDGTNKPVEPILKEAFIKLSISTDPAAIPAQPLKVDIIAKTLDEVAKTNVVGQAAEVIQ